MSPSEKEIENLSLNKKSPKESFNNQASYDKSPERLKSLVETLRKTESGRKAIDFINKNGVAVFFEQSDGYGFYNPARKNLCLNPSFNDEDLALTLMHEARHAKQFAFRMYSHLELTPETMLKSCFMTEADACASECVLAHQMKDLGDRSLFDAHQKTNYAPLSAAFEKEFEKSHDMDKARNAAFMAWYDLPVKDTYAGQQVDMIKKAVKADFLDQIGISKMRTILYKDIGSQKLAEMYCVNADGKCYVDDAAKLDSPEKISVSEKQAKTLKKALRFFSFSNDCTSQPLGLEGIYIKHKDGSYSPLRKEKGKEKEGKNISRLSSAIHGALKEKDGR